jgi:16S rRNA (cytosine1402-N4)-methyltransferase
MVESKKSGAKNSGTENSAGEKSTSGAAAPHEHIPVMTAEVVAALNPSPGKVYIDATFGAGGYSRAIAQAAACRVFGLDRDPSAVALGREMAKSCDGRLTVIEGRFGDMVGLLAANGIAKADGVAFDLGVSSFQIDQPERGFSFAQDGALDMRMGPGGDTAADLVNRLEEKELAQLIFEFGEERRARAIARAIVRARAQAPIQRTGELAKIVSGVVRREPGLHPATRTFQALRIRVNDELGELSRGLAAAEQLLVAGGRLAVVSFHSLEDRMVKRFVDRRSGKTAGTSRHLPAPPAPRAPTFRWLSAGAKRPGQSEIEANPRARSAKLRAAERTDAPAWPADAELARAA